MRTASSRSSGLHPADAGPVQTENLLRGVLSVLQIAIQQPHGRQQHAPQTGQNSFESSCIIGFGLSDERATRALRVPVRYHQQRQFLHAFYRYILLARGNVDRIFASRMKLDDKFRLEQAART
jgi:hypothetical protein